MKVFGVIVLLQITFVYAYPLNVENQSPANIVSVFESAKIIFRHESI